MAILIRDMAMPTKCSECQFCVNGFTEEAPVYECAVLGSGISSDLVDDHGKPFDFRPDWCPLEFVKTVIEGKGEDNERNEEIHC